MKYEIRAELLEQIIEKLKEIIKELMLGYPTPTSLTVKRLESEIAILESSEPDKPKDKVTAEEIHLNHLLEFLYNELKDVTYRDELSNYFIANLKKRLKQIKEIQ